MSRAAAAVLNAAADGLGIYLQLVKQEEHLKRQEALQQRQINLQESQHKDRMTLENKQLDMREKEFEVNKALSQVNTLDKQKEKDLQAASEAFSEKVFGLDTKSEQYQHSLKQLKSLEQQIEAGYAKQAEPYRTVLQKYDYLPKPNSDALIQRPGVGNPQPGQNEQPTIGGGNNQVPEVSILDLLNKNNIATEQAAPTPKPKPINYVPGGHAQPAPFSY